MHSLKVCLKDEKILMITFFQNTIDLDWENLRKSPAPYVPESSGATDLSNFERQTNKVNEDGEADPFAQRQLTMETNGINPEKFRFTRLDILHEENERIFKEAGEADEDEKSRDLPKKGDFQKKKRWSLFEEASKISKK